MTRQQFIHNCRGINDGEDLPDDYLSDIYQRIVLDEIRMLEDGALYPNAIKKGWITLKVHKNNKTLFRWKRMWFILLPKCFLYFKKPGDVEPVGGIDLMKAKIIAKTTVKDKKFCLAVEVLPQVPDSHSSGNKGTNRPTTPSSRPTSPSPSSNSNTNSKKTSKTDGLVDCVSYVLSLPSERELQSWTKITKRYIAETMKNNNDDVSVSTGNAGDDQSKTRSNSM